MDIISLLTDKGAVVEYHDPFVPSFKEHGLDLVFVPDLISVLGEAGFVVIATVHSPYDWAQIMQRSRLIVDTRNVVRR